MVTLSVLVAFIGTFLFKPAVSAAVDNELSQIIQGLHSFEPGFKHQDATFYLKRQPITPSHIEALISLIQQHPNSCMRDNSKIVIDKDKLIEILTPLMYPLSEFNKKALPEILLEKIKTKPWKDSLEIQFKNMYSPELLVIPEAPVLPPISFNSMPSVIEEVKLVEPIILEKSRDLYPKIPEISTRPIPKPIVINAESEQVTPELLVIPEAPILPPISFNDMPSVVEEVKLVEPIILEKSRDLYPEIAKIFTRPIPEPIVINAESEQVTPELLVIPEAPILPPISLNSIPSVVEEVKLAEPIILEKSRDLYPEIAEISARPIPEPIVINAESEVVAPELLVIPEAPILPPISLNSIPSVVEEVKLAEPIILEKSRDVYPEIAEISARHIPEPIVINLDSEQVTPELLVIPEAPILPPISFNSMPSVVEEVKLVEPIILEKSRDLYPEIAEISARPIPEPIVTNAESKLVTPGLLVIPEAPVLAPIPFNSIPLVVEKVKLEEPIILEKSEDLLPLINAKGKNLFPYAASYARKIVEQRIAPNIIFKNKTPKLVNIDIRANVPEVPSSF